MRFLLLLTTSTLLLLLLLSSLAPHSQIAANQDELEDLHRVEWWKRTSFYHIYVRSFKDSDGDGQGDLAGITQKLDYLKWLGVETILLSPFYSSPMKDGGYDIDNHYEVNPRFGSMVDFEDLLAGLKARQMRLVVDFVPNHTSNLHSWFQCSERALLEPEKCGKYRDYYVWKNSTSGGPPTNWKSLFNNGESAWRWSETRREFYLHQFLPEQPDLNLTNPEVREELRRVARFWLGKGADGLRVDAVPHLFEDTLEWRDEPADPNYKPEENPNKYDSLLHIYTKSLYDSARLVRDWRKVASEFSGDRVIITEAYDSIHKIIDYYGPGPDFRFADMPFNFDLLQLFKGHSLRPRTVESNLVRWLDAVQALAWPRKWGQALDPWTVYVTGNHDTSRAWNRIGGENVPLLKWISHLMPASPVDYYGDELALRDANFSSIPVRTLQEGEQTRLAFRTPMPWTGEEPSGGFSSSANIWMPQNDDYQTNNVEELQRAPEGHKNQLRDFVKLQTIRKDYIRSILFGDLVFFHNNPHKSTSVFSFARVHNESLLVVANLEAQLPARVELIGRQSQLGGQLRNPPQIARALLTNFNSELLREGDTVDLNTLELEPNQAAIFGY